MRISTKDEEKVNKKRASEVAREKLETPQKKELSISSIKDKDKILPSADSGKKAPVLSIGSIKNNPTEKMEAAADYEANRANKAHTGSDSSAENFLTKRFTKRRKYNEKKVQFTKRKNAQKSIIAKKEKSNLSEPLSAAPKKKTETKKKETVFQNTAASANKESQSKAFGVKFKAASQITKAAQTSINTTSVGIPFKVAKKAGDAVKKKLQDASKKIQQTAKVKQASEDQKNIQEAINIVKNTVKAVIALLLSFIAIILGPIVMMAIIVIIMVIIIIIIVLAVIWLVTILVSWFTLQTNIDIPGYESLSYIYSFFSERDYGDTQIAAIMGNLYAELSSFDPTYDDGYVLGIMQWTGSNREAIIEWCEKEGYDVYTLKGQCEYMDQTFLESTWNFANYTGVAAYSSIYDITYDEWLELDTSDIDLATGAFCACAERPYYYNSHLEETRIPMAQEFLLLIQSGYFTTQTSDIDYVQYALDMAYDDSIGYSQINRLRNPDVDCSSFVAFALQDAGYTITPSSFSTRTAASVLTRLGFEELTFSSTSALLPGDILWRDGHMEIYVGSSLMVGAHTSTVNGYDYSEGGDQTGQEVSVTLVTDNWTKVYRLSALS